jgi:hypothetical protein
MCYKTTSGLVKRVCAECRQTQKREERLKHKGKDKALEQQHESDLVKRLEQLGIEVDVSPAVTTLTYEQIYTSGPTLEEALLTFLGEALSRYEALRTWKATTMPIVTNGTDKHETQDL